jgi:glutathione S-transferase
MNAPHELFELQLSRFIRAPREKVFDAFVDEALLGAWHCPRGMEVSAAQVDARVGGAWRIDMRSREGTRFVVGGRYREITRPSRLVYSWQWEAGGPMPELQTLVEVDFSEKDGGTELRMRHSGFPLATMRDSHGEGWRSCFNRLSDLLDERGTAATLTLLGDSRSSYTRTVRMALAEKGLAYSFKPCAPHSAEILAVHPFGKIPALLDGDTALWETSAIVKYIDACFGSGPTLTPARIADRVACEQWISAVNCYLYDTMVRRFVLQYFFPRGEGGQPDRGVISGALKEMPAQLRALERAYGARDYLAGDEPSFADLFVAPILAYVEHMPDAQALFADVPNVRRAQAVLRRRASFASTEPQ